MKFITLPELMLPFFVAFSQESASLKLSEPELGSRNIFTMPPPKKLILPSSNAMPPPPPKNMPPPRPSNFTAPKSNLEVHDKARNLDKTRSEIIPGRLQISGFILNP